MKPIKQINTENYEEWFLLFADGELDPAEKKTVFEFIAKHPFLKDELEALQMTVTSADSQIEFENKKALYKVSEETIISFLDNELSQQDLDAATKWSITHHPAFEELKNTYCTSDSTIVFENKNRLFRVTKRTVLFPIWIRWAAAILVGVLIFRFVPIPFGKESEADRTSSEIAVEDRSRVSEDFQNSDTPEIPSDSDSQNKAYSLALETEQKKITEGNSSVLPASDKQRENSLPQSHNKKNQMATPKSTIHSTTNMANQEIVRENRVIENSTMDPAINISVESPSINSVEKDAGRAIAVLSEKNIGTKPGILTVSNSLETINNKRQSARKRSVILKNLGENIKNRMMDVISNGDEEITVAGFAINFSK